MSAGRIFVYLNAALLAGIALGSFVGMYTFWAYLFFATSILGVFIVTKKIGFACSVACAFLFGCFLVWGFLHAAQHKHEQFVKQLPQEFSGVITSVNDQQGLIQVTVSDGDVSMRLYSYDKSFQEGERVIVSCDQTRDELYIPSYVSQGVIAECTSSDMTRQVSDSQNALLARVRTSLLLRVFQAIPSPQAELLQGLLLGKQAHLPHEFEEALRRTGTTHIVVLSGFNITVLAFIINSLFRRLRLTIGVTTLLSVGCIWLFVALAGFTPPTVRAAIMVTLVLVAKSRGRPHSTFVALLFSASLLLLAEPLLLRWSLSFQLSFLATLGVLLKDRFVPDMRFLPDLFSIRDNIRTTFAATLMTLPLIILAFGNISIVGLLTNALVLSLVPLAMALGACIIVASFFSSAVAIYAGIPAYIVLRGMTYIIHTFSEMPFAYISAQRWSALIPVSIFLYLFFSRRKQRTYPDVEPQKKLPLGFLVMICIGVLGVGYYVCFQEQHNVVNFFDVGQGDSIHLRGEDQFDLLVDAGPDETVLSRLGESLPYFDRHIEVFALSHPHADHIKGFFSVVEKYSVGEVWISDSLPSSDLLDALRLECEERHIPIKTIGEGFSQSLGGVVLDTLWPAANFTDANLNNMSLVFRVGMHASTFLFTGDIEKSVEEAMVSKYGSKLQSDILKVAHHGARNSSTEKFLASVNPLISIISVGAENQYKHPHDEAIARLRTNSEYVFRTDECQSIAVDINKGITFTSGCRPEDDEIHRVQF